jgi:hypothetical protein
MAWPVEVQVAVIGAAVAGLGYISKSIVEWWQKKRNERAGIIAQLQTLDSLLKAARALFVLQQEQVKSLWALLKENHPKELSSSEGYDDAMARCYPVMNDKEQELHEIIRAYTEYSLRKINQAMSDWCNVDKVFKAAVAPSSRKSELAQELFSLEIHLMLWHAKYESWIPSHPERALVYLADEKEHGLGFPNEREVKEGSELVKKRGIEAEVASALKELQHKWQ